MRTTHTIKARWTAFEKAVAKDHLERFGEIYIDIDGNPIADDSIIEQAR